MGKGGAKGSTRRQKDRAAEKQLREVFISFSEIDPKEEILCFPGVSFDEFMQDFFQSSCFDCKSGFENKRSCEMHISNKHSRDSICPRCSQVAENVDSHILQIPTNFHHLFDKGRTCRLFDNMRLDENVEVKQPTEGSVGPLKSTALVKIANEKVGLVIGKHGGTLKALKEKSRANITVMPSCVPQGDASVYVHGTEEQIEVAKQLLNETISETRSGVCYRASPPQSNRWPPPPLFSYNHVPGGPSSQDNPSGRSSWAAMVQSNRRPPSPSPPSYMPPSAFPGGPSSHTNVLQPLYQGYSPSSHQIGWGQCANQSGLQQQPAPGGYDYCNHQQQLQVHQSQPTGASSVPPASTDSSYTSQGSNGDASAYFGSYSQPHAGYNYGSATSYATPPTKTYSQDGSAPNYGTPGGGTTTNSTPPQSSPAPQTPTSLTAPSYPMQGYPPVPPQLGYSFGQAVYTQTGYGQRLLPPQPAYGHVQPTGSAQTSYAQAAYGQAAPTQSGYGTGYGAYGQNNESYGGDGGYGQVSAPAYSKDGVSAPGTDCTTDVEQIASDGGTPTAAASKTPSS